jgi:hypothetical protein
MSILNTNVYVYNNKTCNWNIYDNYEIYTKNQNIRLFDCFLICFNHTKCSEPSWQLVFFIVLIIFLFLLCIIMCIPNKCYSNSICKKRNKIFPNENAVPREIIVPNETIPNETIQDEIALI